MKDAMRRSFHLCGIAEERGRERILSRGGRIGKTVGFPARAPLLLQKIHTGVIYFLGAPSVRRRGDFLGLLRSNLVAKTSRNQPTQTMTRGVALVHLCPWSYRQDNNHPRATGSVLPLGAQRRIPSWGIRRSLLC